MRIPKADCTGQKFGYLTVIRKGEYNPKYGRRTWFLRCICGKVIEKPRGEFDRANSRITSCGCIKNKLAADRLRKRAKPDFLGKERFGRLTVIGKGRRINNRQFWRLQCDCGEIVEMRRSQFDNPTAHTVSCGCYRTEIAGWKYPKTPNPYPESSGAIAAKYLHMIPHPDSLVEDIRKDFLIRVAWTIDWRRRQGEEIDDRHERRLIRKHLYYASLCAWRERQKQSGRYTGKRKTSVIGSGMTDLTFQDYPVCESETLGSFDLSNSRQPKKLSFKRR